MRGVVMLGPGAPTRWSIACPIESNSAIVSREKLIFSLPELSKSHIPQISRYGVPTYPLACLFAYLLMYLPTYLPIGPIYQPIMPTYLLAYLLTYQPTNPRVYHTYLSYMHAQRHWHSLYLYLLCNIKIMACSRVMCAWQVSMNLAWSLYLC